MTTQTKILLIGSGFLSSAIFARLYAINNVDITIMDRKDPMGIISHNYDSQRIMQRYAKDFDYDDVFTEKQYGDEKRNTFFKFKFIDWVNENFNGEGFDIVVHGGSIYDTRYSDVNETETLNVNVKGTKNILDNLTGNPLVMYLSSINVYGDQSTCPHEEIDEDSTIPNPKSFLNYTLYSTENLLKASKFNYVILRLATMYGYFTPVSNLVNSAIKALILGQKEFGVYNANESIEVVDIKDVMDVIESIVDRYQKDEYHTIKNQVFNIKAEEKEPKTVDLIVKSVYNSVFNYPTITEDHKIPGFKGGFKLVAPKIAYMYEYDHPRIKFNIPISIKKSVNLLGYSSGRPIMMGMLPITVHYLLGYVLDDVKMPRIKRRIIEKIFGIKSTPSAEDVVDNHDLHNDVKAAVSSTSQKIDKMFTDKEE